MLEKYTLPQLKDSKLYNKYGFILDTVLDSEDQYSLPEVDKKLAKYIGKKV